MILGLRVVALQPLEFVERGIMAHRVVFLDELDGSEGAQTVSFAFEGQEYKIDLSAENMKKFRSVMQPYIHAGRTGPFPTFLP